MTITIESAPVVAAASTALTVGDQVFGDLTDQSKMDHALAFCKTIAATSIVPTQYRGKPHEIFAVAVFARELGVGLLAGLQNIANINGRTTVWGDLMLAVCMNHPEWMSKTVKFSIDGTADVGRPIDNVVATATVKRKGQEPVVETFSIADAVTAGLWGKSGTWSTHPRKMLANKALNFALRSQFPDALRGIQSREDAEEAGEVVVQADAEVVSDTAVDMALRAATSNPAPSAGSGRGDQAIALQDMLARNGMNPERSKQFCEGVLGRKLTPKKKISNDEIGKCIECASEVLILDSDDPRANAEAEVIRAIDERGIDAAKVQFPAGPAATDPDEWHNLLDAIRSGGLDE